MTGNNLMFFYNGATGKFEPIINHIERGSEEDILLFDEVGLLSRRLLSVPAFREERDRRLLAYVNDKTNLEDDLAYYDTLASVMRPEFLSDSVKTVSNLALLRNLKDDRQYIIDSFNTAPGAILHNAYNKPDDLIKDGVSALVTKFPDLIASADTSAAFVRSHPIAYSAQSALRLLPGEHVVYKTLIIPRNTTLFIEAGTTLYFAEGASLVSYSPIIARGSPSSPIQFKALDSRKPWGVVAVVDTKETENVFQYVRAENGSEATVEGVTFTGMLSLYKAGGTIEHSEFRYAHGDDAVNVKGGGIKISDSLFYDNTLDGIDIDFPLPQTSVTKNAFLNNGGDCIDLSWSDIRISDNTLNGSKDKGISVGESSHPTITANTISRCDIGIAVKDSSHAGIENTSIVNSRIGLSLYQKKDIFGGGSAQLKNVVFKSNTQDIEKDTLSSFEVTAN
jgi:parallel beta-helix repeat protein